MNKKIKLLLETLFDDETLSVLDTDDVEINSIPMLNKLFLDKSINREYNKTEFSDNFVDLDNAKELDKLGMIFINNLLEGTISAAGFSFKCEFMEDNSSLQYDKIIFTEYNKNNPKLSIDIFELYVKDKHIYYILYLEPYRRYIVIGNNTMSIKFFDVLTVLLKEYTIDEIRVAPSTQRFDNIKNISLNSYDIESQKALTKNIIDKLPVFTVSDGHDKFVNIYKKFPQCEIHFDYMIITDTLETEFLFLNYWKKQGFKKYKMNSQIGILNTEKGYNGIYDSEDIFLMFMQNNKFVQYSFSDKRSICDVVVDKTIAYCQENYGYISSNSFMYSIEYGNKDKDKQYGSYIIVKVECDFDINDNHLYKYFTWKFYKSGKCDIINVR